MKSLLKALQQNTDLILNSQFLHFALRAINDINGILSYHLITFLHPGQLDRLSTIPSFIGSL